MLTSLNQLPTHQKKIAEIIAKLFAKKIVEILNIFRVMNKIVTIVENLPNNCIAVYGDITKYVFKLSFVNF